MHNILCSQKSCSWSRRREKREKQVEGKEKERNGKREYSSERTEERHAFCKTNSIPTARTNKKDVKINFPFTKGDAVAVVARNNCYQHKRKAKSAYN
ncbi:hypothetical protein TNCV_4103441 [Trichonephila clavipes]|nr:hypothetical protein TNCV_4103441 [Trichonephila clavipes]